MTTTSRRRHFNDLDRTFARNILYFRTLAGRKRQDVAEQVGVTHQQFQKYEQGTNRVTLGRAGEIADALQVPLTVLLESPPEPAEYKFDRDTGRMLRAFHRIRDKECRTHLVRLAELLARQDDSPFE